MSALYTTFDGSKFRKAPAQEALVQVLWFFTVRRMKLVERAAGSISSFVEASDAVKLIPETAIEIN